MSEIKSQPVKYLVDEGSLWSDWSDWDLQSRFRPNQLHAIMFEDGSVFDMVNG